MFIRSRKKQTQEIFELSLDFCYAKTYVRNGQKYLGRTIFDHCYIVGLVARELIKRTPTFLQKFYPKGSELIAALHDVGKISPTFQEKIRRAISGYEDFSEIKPAIEPQLEKQWGGHAGISAISLWNRTSLNNYPSIIVGQHHGYSPVNISSYFQQECIQDIFGGQIWNASREKLIFQLKEKLNCDIPNISTEVQARILSGLTTVSDWIGSGSFFEDPSEVITDGKINCAVELSGFINPNIIKNLSFYDVFGFKPHNFQEQFFEFVKNPGIYILEAPMGLGKTESALYAAYHLLSHGKASGIYFALPTQLTSNKIYERVKSFLFKILSKDSLHKYPKLLHGNSWLIDTEMGEEGQPGRDWFNGSKRSILAPFAVGTIDQALMAVMNVKHGFVRAFGLAGKVVILDEVHSYDLYTGTILDELVKFLREVQCTIIILSATLTSERRANLLQNNVVKKFQYPLVSHLSNYDELTEKALSSETSKIIKLLFVNDENKAIDEALKRARDGQQVLWIENTVMEAQIIYKKLSSQSIYLSIEVGLLHSAFLKKDREANESFWVDIYGKNGAKSRTQKGRILVGTQVLEQSIDIDADFLITNFCPTDMLFQRFGRLWRHSKNQRPISAVCESWVITPSLDICKKNPKKAFGKTGHVYNPYILYRSLQVWLPQRVVSIPEQIRDYIEQTYHEKMEFGELRALKDELELDASKLRNHALIGISKAGKTLSENKASTRYSEIETIECFLFKDFELLNDSLIIRFLDGTELKLDKNIQEKDKSTWRKNAVLLSENTIKIAINKAPKKIDKHDIFNFLADYFYIFDKQNNDEVLLRIAKVDLDGKILSLNGSVINDKYELYYDSLIGYQAKNIK